MLSFPANEHKIIGSSAEELNTHKHDQKIFPVLVDKNFIASQRAEKVKNLAPLVSTECYLLSFQWILKVECLQDVRRIRLPSFVLTLNKQEVNNFNINSEKDIFNNQYLALPLVEYGEILKSAFGLFNFKRSEKHVLKYLDDEDEWCTLTPDNVKDALTLSILKKQLSYRNQSCHENNNSSQMTTYKEENTSCSHSVKNDNNNKNCAAVSCRISEGRKSSQNSKMKYKWVVSKNNKNMKCNTDKQTEQIEENLFFSLPAADISAILHLQLCLNEGFIDKLNKTIIRSNIAAAATNKVGNHKVTVAVQPHNNGSNDKSHNGSNDKSHNGSNDKSHNGSNDKSHNGSNDKNHNTNDDRNGKNHSGSNGKNHSGSNGKNHNGNKDRNHNGSHDKNCKVPAAGPPHHVGSSDKNHNSSCDKNHNGSYDKNHNGSYDKNHKVVVTVQSHHNNNSTDKNHNGSYDKNHNEQEVIEGENKPARSTVRKRKRRRRRKLLENAHLMINNNEINKNEHALHSNNNNGNMSVTLTAKVIKPMKEEKTEPKMQKEESDRKNKSNKTSEKANSKCIPVTNKEKDVINKSGVPVIIYDNNNSTQLFKSPTIHVNVPEHFVNNIESTKTVRENGVNTPSCSGKTKRVKAKSKERTATVIDGENENQTQNEKIFYSNNLIQDKREPNDFQKDEKKERGNYRSEVNFKIDEERNERINEEKNERVNEEKNEEEHYEEKNEEEHYEEKNEEEHYEEKNEEEYYEEKNEEYDEKNEEYDEKNDQKNDQKNNQKNNVYEEEIDDESEEENEDDDFILLY